MFVFEGSEGQIKDFLAEFHFSNFSPKPIVLMKTPATLVG